ncbi:peptide ABC transporter permease [Escherichia coli]|nr:peptide ABC transporter permease [Escherichia coli]
MKRLPQPFDMIHPRPVNWLINHPELRVCFQPAQRFTAFVDDVLFDNERNRLCPPVCRLQMF